MIAGIDTTRLKAFREVAGLGSFTAAATALGISQPAVSQHVAKLEQDLGQPLLDRSGRRVRLTAAGEVFLRHVDSLLIGLDDARRELAAVAQTAGGRLRLAVFPSAAATFVPAVLAQFHAAHPAVAIVMSELDPPASVPRVLAGDVDMALVYDYQRPGVGGDPRLDWETVGVDSMTVAVPADGPLAEDAPVDLRSIACQPWIAPGASMCRDALEDSWRRAGITPRIVTETNDYQAMLRMVGAGMGVAVVPRLVSPMVPAGSVLLRPLAGTRLQRSVALVYRRNATMTAGMDLMRTLLSKAVAAGIELNGSAPKVGSGPVHAPGIERRQLDHEVEFGWPGVPVRAA